MTLVSDIAKLNAAVASVTELSEKNGATIARHEEQISGVRGLSNAIDALAAEVKGLRRAAYWVAGVIVTSSIGFAFTVLQLVG